jgi:hypothetical protein
MRWQVFNRIVNLWWPFSPRETEAERHFFGPGRPEKGSARASQTDTGDGPLSSQPLHFLESPAGETLMDSKSGYEKSKCNCLKRSIERTQWTGVRAQVEKLTSRHLNASTDLQKLRWAVFLMSVLHVFCPRNQRFNVRASEPWQSERSSRIKKTQRARKLLSCDFPLHLPVNICFSPSLNRSDPILSSIKSLQNVDLQKKSENLNGPAWSISKFHKFTLFWGIKVKLKWVLSFVYSFHSDISVCFPSS